MFIRGWSHKVRCRRNCCVKVRSSAFTRKFVLVLIRDSYNFRLKAELLVC